MKLHNKQCIVSITINDTIRPASDIYEWKTEKRVWVFRIRKPGLYMAGWYISNTVRHDMMLIRDNEIFMRPYIQIKFADGDREIKYFDTIDQLTQFMEWLRGEIELDNYINLES